MQSDEVVLLGDEAIALGAVHAGLGAAYGYPGTPSTEILEYLIPLYERGKGPRAAWCANEKTAYEEALGTSFAGKRALVTMKHVGLNRPRPSYPPPTCLSNKAALQHLNTQLLMAAEKLAGPLSLRGHAPREVQELPLLKENVRHELDEGYASAITVIMRPPHPTAGQMAVGAGFCFLEVQVSDAFHR